MIENFPELAYQDVPGLCKVATVEEIVPKDIPWIPEDMLTYLTETERSAQRS